MSEDDTIIIDCAAYSATVQAVHDAIDAAQEGARVVMERATDRARRILHDASEATAIMGDGTEVYSGYDMDNRTWQVLVRA